MRFGQDVGLLSDRTATFDYLARGRDARIIVSERDEVDAQRPSCSNRCSTATTRRQPQGRAQRVELFAAATPSPSD